jgi:hypothetical protein
MAKTQSNKKANLMETSIFLLLFEVSYLINIDKICLLYIRNRHDLYDFIRKKYANSFEDLANIDTTIKFKFLEENNLSILVREKDKQLRNKIAHLDFKIDKKENMVVSGQIIDIKQKSRELSDFSVKITEATTEAITQTRKILDNNDRQF